jgi:hypothetical protein
LLRLPLGPGLYAVEVPSSSAPRLALVDVHPDEVGGGFRVVLPPEVDAGRADPAAPEPEGGAPTTIVAGARLPTLYGRQRSFPRPSALPTLREVARRLADDPALVALVVGHDDPDGDEWEDHALSVARADAVRALLSHDLPDLRRRFTAPDPVLAWGFEEVQWMLSALDVGGAPCYPGVVDGFAGPLTHQAIGWFQAAEGLPRTRLCDEPTLCRLLERYVALVPAVDPARLSVHGGASWHLPSALGSGETPADLDAQDPRHRRVEVFLARERVEPAPAACARDEHAECPAYGAWLRAAGGDFAPPPEPRFTLSLVDPAGDPLCDLSLEVEELRGDETVSAGAGRTDELGLLTLPLAPGLYRVQASDHGPHACVLVHVHPDEVGAGHRVTLPIAAQEVP